MNLKIISAGAGSGKTYRLTQEMVGLLQTQQVKAEGIIGTTFTRKAAAELQERVRVSLLEQGLTETANELANALLGTVHSVGVQLLQRFAFEAGVSPETNIIADEDQQFFFNLALSALLTPEKAAEMDTYAQRLAMEQDWRKVLKEICDAARSNNFSYETLAESREQSFASLQTFLDKPSGEVGQALNSQFAELLTQTIEALENNGDTTKTTEAVRNTLVQIRQALERDGSLPWGEWVKVMKMKAGKKSQTDMELLVAFAEKHDIHPDFQSDIRNFIDAIFDLAIAVLQEYESYKKRRGLIDYVDMECQVNQLLDNQSVIQTLQAELDLLLVDEFQDTSPIQLEIFYKLSRLAKYSIWVGDPKQSIYGFRGAEPRLMQGIIAAAGGVQPENILERSWRSRRDLVYAANALFSKAFPELAAQQFVRLSPDGTSEQIDQVSLIPQRAKEENVRKAFDAADLSLNNTPIAVWHFSSENASTRQPAKPWFENCIATAIAELLARGDKWVVPKDGSAERPLRPSDIAVLCRTNDTCTEVANALHRQGIRATTARNGLLATAEAKLINACLRYILYEKDSLSVAEIRLLASGEALENLMSDRANFMLFSTDETTTYYHYNTWGKEDFFIKLLDNLRPKIAEFSPAELLNVLLEKLDLRRVVASWGNTTQRFDNIDTLRRLAQQYEERCLRLYAACSLGGFLLWLEDLASDQKDAQGLSEDDNAVNVLTYHRSKGLEYPVTVCYDLEKNMQNPVWGLSVQSNVEEIDINNILNNRWLRYWQNPYGKQQQGTLLLEAITESDEYRKSFQNSMSEEARLLYVGITRARDYLIFPIRNTPTKWLNRVWQGGNEEAATLNPDSLYTPWSWQGYDVPQQVEKYVMPTTFTTTEPPLSVSNYFPKKYGKTENVTLKKIDITKESKQYRIKTGAVFVYANYRILESDGDENDEYLLSKCYRYFLDGDMIDLPNEDRKLMVDAIISRFCLSEKVENDDFLKRSHAFYTHLNRHFAPKVWHKKYPMRLRTAEGRLFEGLIDIFLETENGVLVLQHSHYNTDEQTWEAKAKEMAAWWFFTKKCIKNIYKTDNIKLLWHFPLQCKWIEILL